MSDKTIIIAEACQNHQGDRSILKDMIHAAKEAGADFIKVQSMRADDLIFRERFENGVVESGTVKAIKRPYMPEYERLKPLDLDNDGHRWFIDACRQAGIQPLATAFSFNRLPFLAALEWDSIKVASYDCASHPFIAALKRRFRRLYISTGSTLDDEIRRTAGLLAGHSFSLLHCVTIYPTPLHELHLARMEWLRTFTPSVGFSDHSLVERDGLKASIGALCHGAQVIERHFTILPRDKTKDGPVSIDPRELKELVNFARMPREDLLRHAEKRVPELASMAGSAHRSMSEAELLNRDYYRGRFASRAGDKVIFNWEEPLEEWLPRRAP